MSKITDKISYLQGLADGMKLSKEVDSNKLLLEMLSVMGEMGAALEELTDAHNDLTDYVEAVDDDLADLEDAMMGEDDEEDDDEEDDDEIITYTCPHCGQEIEFEAGSVDFDEDYICPACGKPVFPEMPEE